MIRIVPAPNGSGGGGGLVIGGSVSGGTTGRVLFEGAGPVLADSANFLYSNTGSPGSGPFLTVGSGATTSAGFSFGEISSNLAGIWLTGTGSPTTANYFLSGNDPGGGGTVSMSLNGATGAAFLVKYANATKFAVTNANTDTYIDGSAAASVFHFRIDGNNEKLALYGTAGKGPLITAGTATTDVQALSATQTFNNGAVTFTHEKHLITDTASAAGSKAVAYFGGTAAATVLFAVYNTGMLQLGTTYAAGVTTATGTVPIVDATGTTYNVLVHT